MNRTVRIKMYRWVAHCLAGLAVVGLGLGLTAYVYRQELRPDAKGEALAPSPAANVNNATVRVSAEARKNMGLVAAPLSLSSYEKTIEIPGIVIDRPGVSDRGVVAPVTGTVIQIHAYPGSAVAPQEPLFTLRLISETLHASQLELFKASREIEIARQQQERLQDLAATGGIAGSRMIEIDNQILRMEVQVQAYRQDLLARGLPLDRIDAAARGEFVTEIVVRAPADLDRHVAESSSRTFGANQPPRMPFNYEMHALNVALGEQVEAGEVLCRLADHRSLMIEGHGFKKDLPLIQQAIVEKLPVRVVFDDDPDEQWPLFEHRRLIDHVANTIDISTRTFAFYVPLENQWKVYRSQDSERFLWRFRPGDRARLLVAVDRVDNVYVLPQAALVREGPEAFVFLQNGDLFNRIAVHLIHQDRTSVVIDSSGKLRAGSYVALNSAASLNRVLKAQQASGQPAALHVHADGTVHAAH